MKQVLFIFLTVIMLSSCGNSSSEPEVTYTSPEFTLNNDYTLGGGEIAFRGSRVHTLYDKNRKCQNKDQAFGVTKSINNNIINSADKCDYCGHAWYVHEKN